MTATLTLYNTAIATLKCTMRLKIIGIEFYHWVYANLFWTIIILFNKH